MLLPLHSAALSGSTLQSAMSARARWRICRSVEGSGVRSDCAFGTVAPEPPLMAFCVTGREPLPGGFFV